LRLWDASLAFLFFASLGAWGVAAVSFLGVREPLWSLAFTRLFLDLFADGWFVLAVLGLLFVTRPTRAQRTTATWGETLLIIGLPLTFLIGLPAGALPSAVRWLAGISGAGVAAGLLLLLAAVLPSVWERAHRRWILPLAFLALKAVVLLVMSFPGGAAWASQMGLRLSYLHWLLLGYVTLGLFAATVERWSLPWTRLHGWFAAAVLLLLATLLPLTRLWPTAWGGRWTLTLAAWGALGPVVVVLILLLAWLRPHMMKAAGGIPAHNLE
jgi:hypothetical protein